MVITFCLIKLIVSSFDFFVPAQTLRNINYYFYMKVVHNNSKIMNFSPTYRISLLCNVNHDWFDIFQLSEYQVKSKFCILSEFVFFGYFFYRICYSAFFSVLFFMVDKFFFYIFFM